MLLQLFLLVFFASYAKSECMVNSDKEFEGSCFTFYSQQLNFTDARNWCHNKNPAGPSYLAYVPDQITANFLASELLNILRLNTHLFYSQGQPRIWTWIRKILDWAEPQQFDQSIRLGQREASNLYQFRHH